MSTPSLASYSNGISQVSGDNLNTFTQWAVTVAQLRAFAPNPAVPNMLVYLQGFIATNDGGQGNFYWNPITGTDDGGVTTIVPNGSTAGCWSRLNNIPNGSETGTGNLVLQNTPTLITPVLGVATATSINFGQSPLDWYQEGTWTPIVGGSATYSMQVGIYTRVGRMVLVKCQVQINSIGSGSTGQISGLPFASSSIFPGSVGYFSGSATNATALSCYVNGTTINIGGQTAAASGTTDPITFFANSANIHLSVTYSI